jgi:hypothetical protein
MTMSVRAELRASRNRSKEARVKRRVGALLMCGTIVIACGGGGGQAESVPQGAAVSTGEFGVPECDDYMRKYLACIDSKVPESARVMMRQQIDQTKASWKQAASTEQGKAALATGCRQATEAAKAAMQAYGCTW